MLFETSKGRRRLFRPGDPFHPRRHSGKDIPHDGEIPPAYRKLNDGRLSRKNIRGVHFIRPLEKVML